MPNKMMLMIAGKLPTDMESLKKACGETIPPLVEEHLEVRSTSKAGSVPKWVSFRILYLQRRLFAQVGLLLVTFFEKRSPK